MQQGPMDSTGSYMLCNDLYVKRASLLAQMVKNLPSMQETWVQALGWEDPLEKEMAPHSSTLAWKSHGRRSLVGYSPWGLKESDTTERFHFFPGKWYFIHCWWKGEYVKWCSHFGK